MVMIFRGYSVMYPCPIPVATIASPIRPPRLPSTVLCPNQSQMIAVGHGSPPGQPIEQRLTRKLPLKSYTPAAEPDPKETLKPLINVAKIRSRIDL